MANYKKSKAEMRKVYMRRRIIALVVLLLIILLIISRCSKSNDKDKNKTQQTTTTTQTTQTTETQPVEVSRENEENVPPTEATGTETKNSENTENTETKEPAENEGDENSETSSNENKNSEATKKMEEELNKYYEEVADVEYSAYNNAYYFDLKNDAKSLYLKKDSTESDGKAFQTFWSDFKKDLIKSSQEITENIEPRIELHIVSPVDNKSTAVMIKDGEEIFDITER